ncbi:hypothetical protein E4A48_08685 [Xanthomonas cerealis pv. cerealis]|uniref:Uncharacterized protein n=2 Tax=Xanthomonas translucens group TaxID=3390202 RepID=A0A514ECJ7_9XANT|nr:hypothetical protein [Xanthomonas translucens]QDI03766.1 hypothetical protein E4A48_08685 [Xanthomonas translucens pv. cerealis]QSQ35273.1 hypothetical protein ISN31_06920 [Xanthomonas translucens pv. translucens]QSQ44085.1 hypothetical protein ISN34_12345 [Xanthomonas translucens pv. translucens]
MPEDEIPFQADVLREDGRVVGANFKGQVDTATFNGNVKTGHAEVTVQQGNAFGTASTNGTSMDGSVGLKTTQDHFEFSASFTPGGELNGSGKVTVGAVSYEFSNSSVGTTFSFDSGASASISRGFDGAWNANWSSPTIGGFQTSLSFGSSSSSWSINANFTLKGN